ncbi:MAG: hypothetical protein LBG50_02815 [Clostridiales Family XIII bacterium]|jgi:hypothetical protein|nr:hypothetical protein [Clostridiales Family XIII bacterium]
MKTIARKMHIAVTRRMLAKRDGMELVQVAILVALAILIGLVFKTQIKAFVEDVFKNLTVGKFS